MTLNGIYAAVFIANQDAVGAGVIVIDGGRLHGGDTSFFYRGKYRLDGQNEKKITANVEVEKHSPYLESVYGQLDSYRLTLTGIIQPTGFTLSGQVAGQSELTMDIQLRRVSNLIGE